MRFTILDSGEAVRPDDLCMFVYVAKSGTVKYKCGRHFLYTEPDGDTRYSVLRDGRIPELEGYSLIVAVRPVREFEDVPIFDTETGVVDRE